MEERTIEVVNSRDRWKEFTDKALIGDSGHSEEQAVESNSPNGVSNVFCLVDNVLV